MKLTNDTFISTKNTSERYYRDRKGWLKISSRGRIPRDCRTSSKSRFARARRCEG
jgi:hypothetical protein